MSCRLHKIGVATAENEPIKACGYVHTLPVPGHQFRSADKKLLQAIVMRASIKCSGRSSATLAATSDADEKEANIVRCEQ